MERYGKHFLSGVWTKDSALLVTDEDLTNLEFIRDGRALCLRENKKPEQWIDHVANRYRDYQGSILHAEGHEMFLNMEVLEVPFIREWFRDFACTPCPDDVAPRVRIEAKARARVLLTIMRASYPKEAATWGLRADNNNDEAGNQKRWP